ncbi:MAG: AAA family ATPase, partial [candidate division Zixibacteria bacterium]|nr:AAA family ATPase [candidate division Zixibacteria bacterium]
KPKPIEENGFSEGNGFNVARYLDAYEIRYKTKQESTRTIYALSRCLFAAAHTTKDVKGDSSIIQGSDGKLGYHCFHAHCDGRTWKDARQAISGDASIARFFRGNKTPKLTPLMNARQLESMEFPEVAPVIDSGILPSQTGMVFAGPSGVGKSIIAIEWGIRLCHGMDILSFRVPEARRVLMIQKENALAQVKHRIRQICGGLKLSHAPENLFMTSVEERFNLRKSEDLEKLAGYIEMAKAETCILDPLS